MSKTTRWATPEEISVRAEMLRTLMLDAAVDQFAELQRMKEQIATLTAERDEAVAERDLHKAYAETYSEAAARNRDKVSALTAEVATVREVWNIDLNTSRDRVLTLEIENQHAQQQMAEQREQLDRALKHEAALCADRAAMNEQIVAMQEQFEADNRTQAAYHEQIATLTAEYGAVLLKLDTCRGEAAKERHALNAQLDAMNVVLTETAHSYRHLREQFDEGLRMLASKDAEHDALNAQLDLYMAENEALHAQLATVMAEGE